ncbi:MAG: hypothetical protein LUG98_11490, partial [Tannerellaceae bacterium]|nr:hypothetical protein [Tannerellaceae bacterium]
AVNDVQISVATPTLAAGTTTLRTQTVTVPAAPEERTVQIQYLHPATNQWTTINTFLQPEQLWILTTGAKRVVAKADALLYGVTGAQAMNWAQAMGINPNYNTTHFNYDNDLQNNFYTNATYVPDPAYMTGCNAYWEESPTDPKTGQGHWRVPTYDESREIMANDDKAVSYNILRSAYYVYWTSREASLTPYQATTNYWMSGNVYVGASGKVNSVAGTTTIYIVRCVRAQ